MIRTTYWLTSPPDGPRRVEMHVDDYARWVVAVEYVLEHHPHWRWWDRLWSVVLPDYGDPLCYLYCALWSIHDRSRHHVSIPVTIEQVPPQERQWIERALAESASDELVSESQKHSDSAGSPVDAARRRGEM